MSESFKISSIEREMVRKVSWANENKEIISVAVLLNETIECHHLNSRGNNIQMNENEH